MANYAPYFAYWGKTSKKENIHDQGDAYHLLPYHCLDVAACGWQMVMRNRFHAADIFAELGFSREEAARWFAWILGLHDIGKFARGFQQLNKTSYPDLVPGISGIGYPERHDSLGYWFWQGLRKAWPNALPALTRESERTLDIWLNVVTGHHGLPPLKDVKGSVAFTPEDKVAAGEWMAALSSLLNVTDFPDRFCDKIWRKKLCQQSWLLAGLTTLADWMGSNQHDFPLVSTVMPDSAYWQRALAQATHALAQLPQLSSVDTHRIPADLFPFIQHLTPLQQSAMDIAISAEGPQLFVLEDVTGAGKTEAALILTQRLMAQGKGDSLYVGLPTMATSNAMFQRLATAYRALFVAEQRPSLVLAHGSSDMSEAFTHSLWSSRNAGQSAYIADEQAASSACNIWFADSRKKSLLAEVGVGTLDQALMAAMPFRHQSLRLLGLYRKILLLDEVHAYDSYMVRLLEGLLTFHAAQGGSVIILSATLPSSLRHTLLNAFQRGINGAPVIADQNAGYPWLSHLSSQGVSERYIPTRPEVARRVAVQWLNDPDSARELILRTVESGQCICWIRNTVDDAITVYRQLLDSGLVPPENLLLFHSRFAFIDRMAIENRALEWFGKSSTPTLRRGKVLIATQVVEQSLDLDIDVMISDLAPVDLLIQRAGRLQRHIRDRHGALTGQMPDGRLSPALHILAPEWQPEAESGWLGEHLKGTGYVYEDHACLWRTQAILRDKGEIRMPEDARELVESVYEAWIAAPVGLQAQEDNVYGKDLSVKAAAKQNILDWETGYHRTASMAGWSDDVELSTRLSEPTVDVFLAWRAEGGSLQSYARLEPFSWQQSRLSLRETLWQKIAANAPCLQGEELEHFRHEIHNPNAQVLLLTEGDASAVYSKAWGLSSQHLQ
ncbi:MULTISPECIES: CRISPR-associated helicase/endonuclease Cas3 [Citrobacter]|jgi:CRISPR-associated endonuclease/helicase Cas3|uniref:CRISPR-associated helicase/endonuclease Cas3 n=1 Tax=Citrobacter TaxID=544 RepID=UPI000CEF023A|nr:MULTISPECIES: CRISPR-associated helicase/endonuclease Cas3 [Citrobacter]MBR7613796.1 CRISPR-associated helicase/endonuclease Cas3 [Citrobacter braakii]MDL4472764.1 CRISPR-associated helicase/endonuclease Cas3 [Citrobacter braakii]MDL4504493.1 CRISPR-associated helicase/endonuclease Cas3 [Citrobacter braakii]MDM3378961.1 CRISPR-associated helicase/endonuclease Cas3 [Citrobacter sp. Cb003]PPS52525.1 CRISPR-associated helicase/endonuclease Cas3 [Citrobacter braakii]